MLIINKGLGGIAEDIKGEIKKNKQINYFHCIYFRFSDLDILNFWTLSPVSKLTERT